MSLNRKTKIMLVCLCMVSIVLFIGIIDVSEIKEHVYCGEYEILLIGTVPVFFENENYGDVELCPHKNLGGT